MAETPEQRLELLGHPLPGTVELASNLLSFKTDPGQVFVSGQLPLESGQRRYVGKVGQSISREEGYAAARLASLNVVAQLSYATNNQLSKIIEVVKVSGFVNCTADFADIPFIVNGASDLFVAVFGDRGRHARFAIGVASLPRGVPFEIDVIAGILDEE
ncbi:RidA family protein [Neorhizobium lilium]|uniref:RidA family protein n=1 Tax=Neorhizobium lilium TaxID=2503024 RepID=A0A3S3SIP2_9HYPH|nr:RidA family protein [Neorhizobium lilium]RWX81443.1 RidA family protein [Neorhizobium lilium]